MNPTNDARDRLLIAAGAALRANRLEDAGRSALQALELDPGSTTAKFLAGVVFSRTGDSSRACELLNQVLDAEPNSFEALISLATLYRQGGDWELAASLAVRAVAINPNDPQAHNHLGRCLLAGRRLEGAAAAFTRAIALQPGFAAAHHNLGQIRRLEGKDGEAAQCFAQAAALAPTPENVLAYGNMLLALYDLTGAAAVGRRAVAQFPASAAAHLLLCGVLIETNETAEAEEHLRQAIQLDSEGKEALQIAARQLPLGHVDAANQNLRRAIDQNPRQISAYESLMHNQMVTERDRPLIDQMQALLSEGALSPTELGSLNYALGKGHEDLGEFEAAMRHYDAANRIVREINFGPAPFDEAKYSKHVDRMIHAFSPEDGSTRLSGASASELPILIVGMMRSGTTLVEQIISSHPVVAAAGEQLFWARNWTRTLPSALGIVDPAEVAHLGSEYIAELSKIGNGAHRVTDKLPGNYMFAGLIHQALPGARFVHVRRSPADTCLSIWATPNHAPSEGGHDKGNIVFVYREYLRLMRQWRSVLPADRLLEIDYEELVVDRERMTRRIVDFCGLPWDEACLRPQDNSRKVTTLSVWQVRQPVYRTSIERWRKFEPWLGEFAELLELSSAGVSSIPRTKRHDGTNLPSTTETPADL